MRNDYCQTFVDTGLRPQNFIRDLDYPSRYSEYPKIERLISLKDAVGSANLRHQPLERKQTQKLRTPIIQNAPESGRKGYNANQETT
eukprot:1465676-Amphidinium_carterae.1